MNVLGILSWYVLSVSAVAGANVSKKCGLDEHWVRAHHRRAYLRGDGTHVAASNVLAHCSRNPGGYAIWKERLLAGRPANWPHLKEETSLWREDEQERLLEAIESLPDVLGRLKLNGIYRLKKSIFDGNPASGFGGNLVLYDEVFNPQTKNFDQILCHELAHQLFEGLSDEDKKDYGLATNWYFEESDGIKTGRMVRRQSGYVEADGRQSIDEDFANNIEYFIFKSAVLHRITPGAYSWIKGKYGDSLKWGKKKK